MVRFFALLALISFTAQAEELDHAQGYGGGLYGACMAACQALPNVNAQFVCKLSQCGGLQGHVGYGPGHPGNWTGDVGYGVNPYGSCAALGGYTPSVVGCPGGTYQQNLAGGPCCLPFGAGGFPVAGIFPGFPSGAFPGGRCGGTVRTACELSYNCQNHPESQGCFTFCRLQSGC